MQMRDVVWMMSRDRRRQWSIYLTGLSLKRLNSLRDDDDDAAGGLSLSNPSNPDDDSGTGLQGPIPAYEHDE